MPTGYTFQYVQSELRIWLPYFAIASITFAAGVCFLLLSLMRSRERLFFWTSAFSLIYAIRLFAENNLVHSALGLNEQVTRTTILCLTYLIHIPYALFARELLGSGWRNSIQIWLWIVIAFATVAAPTAVLQPRLVPFTGHINQGLVIAGTLLVLAHLLLGSASHSLARSLTLPLTLCGILIVLNNLGFRWGHLDIEPSGFLVLLAGLAFVAIRRALQRERQLVEVEQELNTAKRIQRSIIPTELPGLPRLRVAASYRPMTAVAGDFYDFLPIDDGCITLLVADVSGHGVPAALVASMLKVCFAAQKAVATNPAAILSGLNSMLRGSLGGQYVTAVCATIDLQAASLTYASAGHPPPLLLSNGPSRLTALREGGLFLGPFPETQYSNSTVPIQQGDKLILYTDGITEATNRNGQEFGLEALESLLLRTRTAEPSAVLATLFQELSSAEQQDDWTVILAEFI